ncbi:endopeptidase La [Mycoplasma sp. CB776]
MQNKTKNKMLLLNFDEVFLFTKKVIRLDEQEFKFLWKEREKYGENNDLSEGFPVVISHFDLWIDSTMNMEVIPDEEKVGIVWRIIDIKREMKTFVELNMLPTAQKVKINSFSPVDKSFSRIIGQDVDAEFIKFNSSSLGAVKAGIRKMEEEFSNHSFLKPIKEFFEPLFSLKNLMDENEIIFPLLAIAEEVDLPKEYKKRLIFATDNLQRLAAMADFINSLIQERAIVNEIENKMKKTLDKQQKEFILREKMRAIRQTLGDEDSQEEKNEKELFKKDDENKFPLEVREIIKNETRKLKGMLSSSPEANVTKNYLDLIYNLPWRKVKIDHLDIEQASKELAKKHFGLKDVKERILEFLAVLTNIKNKNDEKKLNIIKPLPTENAALDLSLFDKHSNKLNNNMPILTLVGPPGTGKTSIAQSISDAIGRKMIKISLGGVRDESEIRGHRRTYVGAMPGKIINAIKKAGVSNPVILLDEIDKMSSDFRGDPASAMLEVLDPEQNKFFQDHYLETEYDLSKVIFIATANYFDGIPEALADRMEIIELSSYTLLEKKEIAKNHLLDKVLSETQLDKKYFNIDLETIEYIIKSYTREAGVRDLKRNLDKIARKIIVKLLKNEISKDKDFIVDKKVVTDMLGIEKFSDDINETKPQIGIVNGLAYTAYGGSTLSIEVNTVPSTKAEIKLTGQLKDVMRESAEIAISYVRANAKEFGIDFDFENNQIHIHVPEGAVPKDGPSAGVTFTTAIISALAKKPVSPTIGMTGEITLRGKVLAIGGLKEKTLAAYKFGIKTIFIPKDNEKNIVDLAEEVKENITFHPVSNYQEIYNYIFKSQTKSK